MTKDLPLPFRVKRCFGIGAIDEAIYFAIFIGFITIFYNQAIGSILGAIQHLRQGNKVKYVFIAQHKKTWPVDLMCRLLGVTRGGYYGYQRRGGGDIDYYRQE
tara:strand:+ start:3776 stop:4084 length:309 start_codon:yes stop_codon:yes gene_type:complete